MDSIKGILWAAQMTALIDTIFEMIKGLDRTELICILGVLTDQWAAIHTKDDMNEMLATLIQLRKEVQKELGDFPKDAIKKGEQK